MTEDFPQNKILHSTYYEIDMIFSNIATQHNSKHRCAQNAFLSSNNYLNFPTEAIVSEAISWRGVAEP